MIHVLEFLLAVIFVLVIAWLLGAPLPGLTTGT